MDSQRSELPLCTAETSPWHTQVSRSNCFLQTAWHILPLLLAAHTLGKVNHQKYPGCLPPSSFSSPSSLIRLTRAIKNGNQTDNPILEIDTFLRVESWEQEIGIVIGNEKWPWWEAILWAVFQSCSSDALESFPFNVTVNVLIPEGKWHHMFVSYIEHIWPSMDWKEAFISKHSLFVQRYCRNLYSLRK